MKVRDLIKFLADQPSNYDVVFPSKDSDKAWKHIEESHFRLGRGFHLIFQGMGNTERLLREIIPANELFGYINIKQDDMKLKQAMSIRGNSDFSDFYRIGVDTVLKGLMFENKDSYGNLLDYYWIPKDCRGNDYFGGTTSMANYLAIEKDYRNSPGVYYLQGSDGNSSPGVYYLQGSGGDYGVAISLRWLIADSVEAQKLVDILTKLQNDPIIDHEILDKYENQLIDSAWDDWGRDHFIKSIETKFQLKLEIEKNEEGEFRKFFEQQAFEANQKWELIKDGQRKMVIDIGKVIDYVSVVVLNRHWIKLISVGSKTLRTYTEWLALLNFEIEEVPIKRALRVNFQRFIILRQKNR